MPGLCLAEMTAVEILNRYDRTQQYQKNRNIYMQTFQGGTDSFLETSAIPALKTELRFITDGSRMDFLWERWDKFGSESTPTDEIKSNKVHYIWDGNKYYNYKDRIKLLLISDKYLSDKPLSDDHLGRTYYNAYPGAVSDGFFSGDFKSFSKILKGDNIQIDAKKIDSDGNTLYFIEADTSYGHYKIYFDPKYEFNVVKAELRKTGNDICYGESLNTTHEGAVDPYGFPVTPRTELVMTLSNNEFKQVDNCWIPVNSNWEVQVTYENGRVQCDKYRSKTTSVELNPDFEALNAFIPNFPNNTKVQYMESKSPAPLVWLDGKVVVDINSDELRAIDDAIIDMKDSKVIERKAKVLEPAPSPVLNTAEQIINDSDSNVPGSKDEFATKSSRNKYYILSLMIILPLLVYIIYKYAKNGNRGINK